MGRISIVTDSTSDLPPALASRLGIEIVPLPVLFGNESFRDGIDLTAEQFYARLPTSPQPPRTSQPSPAEFVEVYERLTANGGTVISLHLSEKLSGTLGSARLAAQMLTGRDIRVLDTKSVSLGLGLLTVAAAEQAQAGQSADAIVASISALIPRVRILFAVETLEYLQRNGRIGKAQAMLGSLLSVKPLLQIENGQVAPLDKVRGKARVIPRLLELVAEHVPPGARVRFGLLHANVPDVAQTIAADLAAQYPDAACEIGVIGAVVGTHAGPGALGIAIVPEAASA